MNVLVLLIMRTSIILSLLALFPLIMEQDDPGDTHFPEYEGLILSEEARSFEPGTLWDYINGAADSYLSYEFQHLDVGEYHQSEENYIKVELYRHKNTIEAFGIYSIERSPDFEFIEIGAQGYQVDNILNFVCDKYYVKMEARGDDTVMNPHLYTLAIRIEESIDKNSEFPPIIESFPEEGLIGNSELYISKSFLGYDFLNSAFTANYLVGDREFQLFIIDGKDPSSCRQILSEYLEFCKQPVSSIHEGVFAFEDPYNGPIRIIWKDSYLYGVMNFGDDELAGKYLRLMDGIME